MQSELKACPFCPKSAVGLFHAEEIREGSDLDGYAVCCDMTAGGCGATGGYRPSEAEAIAAWNTRAEGDATLCQNASMGEHACGNRNQCWEPCGELGHSEEHARSVPAMEPTMTTDLEKEREAFEAAHDFWDLSRRDDGSYLDLTVDNRWLSWLLCATSRAALAAPAAPQKTTVPAHKLRELISNWEREAPDLSSRWHEGMRTAACDLECLLSAHTAQAAPQEQPSDEDIDKLWASAHWNFSGETGNAPQRFARALLSRYGAAPQRAEDTRLCTCHSDDRPKGPCRQKYAASECQKDAQPAGRDARQDEKTRCSNALREQGKAYPRTCRECGLGPCNFTPKEITMAERSEDGGPAFPARVGSSNLPLQVGQYEWMMPGMSLRDYFAAKAMQSYLTLHPDFDAYEDAVAADSYKQADAMLRAREE